VNASCRAGEITLFGDGDEVIELPQIHCRVLPACTIIDRSNLFFQFPFRAARTK
jgi:hypothetical protein